MKNLLFTFFLISLMSALGCHPTSSTDTSSRCYASHNETNQIGELNLISFQTAMDLSRRYAADSMKSIIYSETGKKTQDLDAVSITFPMEQLKSFIAMAENAICTGKCDKNTPLAMRIYYGKYPDSTKMKTLDLQTLPNNYANHHTLFLVPLYQKSDGRWIEFNPIEKSITCESVQPIINSNTKPAFLSLGPSQSPDPSNHGGLRPPPYDDSQYTFPQN